MCSRFYLVHFCAACDAAEAEGEAEVSVPRRRLSAVEVTNPEEHARQLQDMADPEQNKHERVEYVEGADGELHQRIVRRPKEGDVLESMPRRPVGSAAIGHREDTGDKYVPADDHVSKTQPR